MDKTPHTPYDWNRDNLALRRRQTLAQLCANLRDACDELHTLLSIPPEPIEIPKLELVAATPTRRVHLLDGRPVDVPVHLLDPRDDT